LVGYSDFPYLAQAFCIHRHTTDLNGKELRSECAYGVTSLSTSKATPAQVLDFNRGHWSIENKVHWVRDVTFDEDRSRVRKKSGPQVMASLRNLAISMLRIAGADNVAEALRFCSWNSRRPLRLIGIAFA
jgi:hypothetical protein